MSSVCNTQLLKTLHWVSSFLTVNPKTLLLPALLFDTCLLLQFHPLLCSLLHLFVPVTFISSLFLKYAKYTSALCVLCLLLRTFLPHVFVKLTSSFSSQCQLSEKLSLTTLVKQLPISISIFLVFFPSQCISLSYIIIIQTYLFVHSIYTCPRTRGQKNMFRNLFTSSSVRSAQYLCGTYD